MGFNFGDDGTISDKFQLANSAMKWPAHAVFIALMLASNALMLKFYVISMQENGAAKATVINFAVSYISSVITTKLSFLCFRYYSVGHFSKSRSHSDWPRECL